MVYTVQEIVGFYYTNNKSVSAATWQLNAAHPGTNVKSKYVTKLLQKFVEKSLFLQFNVIKLLHEGCEFDINCSTQEEIWESPYLKHLFKL